MTKFYAWADGLIAARLDSRGDDLITDLIGAGIHYCVGASLARAEMQEALGALARTSPSPARPAFNGFRRAARGRRLPAPPASPGPRRPAL